jgi:PAS domain S-box-containing protein
VPPVNSPEKSGNTAPPDDTSEAEETLRAIREGKVDALVVRRAMTEEIFSLQGWDDSYHAFMETMDHGAAALGAAGEVLYANDILCRLLGKSLSEIQGSSILDSLPPSTHRDIEGLLRNSRTGKQTAEVAIERDGEDRFFLISATPFETGVISGSALTMTDLTDRVLAERDAASERSARAIIASANEAVVVCDSDGRITHVNAAVYAIQPGDLLGKYFHDAINLEFPNASGVVQSDDLVAMANRGRTLQGIEAHAPDAPRVKDLLISVAPLTLSGEAISGCVVTMVDLSQRKIAERQQLLMMRELDHRIKNTLALVLSISHRTAASEDTIEGFQDAFSARIQALAATHNLLAETSWADLVLKDLAMGELAPFVPPGSSRIHLENLDIRLTSRAAVAVGLILHELVTNAVKYGALSTESGKLRLSARRDPEQKCLRLDWVESNGPPVSEPKRHGFGRTVIDRTLRYSSSGGADLDFHPDGVRCSMRIPAEDIAER